MLLLHADPLMARARLEAQITAVLAFLLMIAVGRILWRRRQLQAARRAALTQMNMELEARVKERTDELNRINLALAAEITERENAETKVRRLGDELAQANRLSILGQIAAGVAHEMNQPLAAIGVYAHNAGRFLETASPPPLPTASPRSSPSPSRSAARPRRCARSLAAPRAPRRC